MRGSWWSIPWLALLVLVAGCAEPVRMERDWELPGGTAQVEVYVASERGAEEMVAEMRATMQRVSATMDPRDEAGELSRLNRAAQADFYEVEDPDLYRLLLLALDYARASRGAYDPTAGPLIDLYDGAPPSPAQVERTLESVGWAGVTQAPEARAFRFRQAGMELRLGPLARGFALDAATRAFSRMGSLGGRLQLGGQIYVWGQSPDGPAWTVELVDPRRPERTLLTLEADNRGISITARGAPDDPLPIDPRSGRPAASDVLVAVAVADTAADAAAMSSALFVAGSKDGARLLAKTRQVEVVLLVDGNDGLYLLASASLRGRLHPGPELKLETGGPVRYLLPPDKIFDPSAPLARSDP